MIDEWLHAVTGSVWALPTLFALVLADSFLVVLPGEAAVTAFGALAVSTGTPPLALVIAVAAAAAVCGDAVLFFIGRSVGLERWRWMRAPRAQTAFACAIGIALALGFALDAVVARVGRRRTQARR